MCAQALKSDEGSELLKVHVLQNFITVLISSQDSRASCIDQESQTEHVLSTFIATESPQALYVVLLIDGGFSILTEMPEQIPNDTVQMSTILKHSDPLRSDVSLHSQLNVFCFPIDEAYNTKNESSPAFVRDLLNHVVTPYFDRLTLDTDKNASNTLETARKKLYELNASLNYVHLQIDVPDLLNYVLPTILDILRAPEVNDSTLQDTTVLNELTQIANTWIRTILSITRTSKNPSGVWSMADEKKFWASMETALEGVQQQVQQPEVQRLIDILAAAKRFQTTLIFQNNLRIAEKLEEVKHYNAFLKDLPIDGLRDAVQSSNKLSDIEASITAIFSHLKRWKSLTTFPLLRIIELIELVLRDISQHLKEILSSLSIMALPQDAFENAVNGKVRGIFLTLDNSIKHMMNVLRELMRKRLEKFMIIKIDREDIDQIELRVQHLAKLKSKHHELSQSLTTSVVDDSINDYLTKAFNKHIVGTEHFDFTSHGALIWAAEEDSYLEIHNQVLKMLSTSLNNGITCCLSFDNFVSFFQQIQGNNSSMSTLLPLIDDSHIVRFLLLAHSMIQDLSSCDANTQNAADNDRNIEDPAALFKIIKSRLSRKARLENIINSLNRTLGDNWTLFAMGSQIRDLTSYLAERLEVSTLFDQWTCLVQSSLHDLKNLSGLFRIQEESDPLFKGMSLNYPYQLMDVPSSLSYYSFMGLRASSDIILQANKIKIMKPIIFTLDEHIEVFSQILNKEQSENGFKTILDPLKRDALQNLLALTSFSWVDIQLDVSQNREDSDFSNFEAKSLRQVHLFQEATYSLLDMQRTMANFGKTLIDDLIPNIMTSKFEVATIQRTIDIARNASLPIVLKSSNAAGFQEALHAQLRQALLNKCTTAVANFRAEVKGEIAASSDLQNMYHVLHYENGNFLIEPPLSSTRACWVSVIDEKVKAISSITVEGFDGIRYPVCHDYSEILMETVNEALHDIDLVFEMLNAAMEEWRSLGEALQIHLEPESSFNDLDVADLLKKASNFLALGKLLNDPRGISKLSGVIDVLFSMVRNQVSGMYEKSKSKLLADFIIKVTQAGLGLLNAMRDSEKRLSNEPNLLYDFQTILNFVVHVLQSKKNIRGWKEFQVLIGECQRLLHRSKIQLPGDWIYPDQLENRVSNLELLISKRMSFVTENLDFFQTRLAQEMNRCNQDLERITNEWFKERSITESTEPGLALSILAKLQKRLNALDASRKRVIEVAEELKVAIPSAILFLTLQDDIDDLGLVWSSLQDVWNSLEEIKRCQWSDTQPRKVKQQLDGLLSSMKKLPALVRHYSAFGVLKNTLSSFSDELVFLQELKAGSLKSRHWNSIFALVDPSLNVSYDSMKLLQVLDMGLKLHQGSIRTILKQANDEQIVEESLNSIEDEWSSIVFETFDFNGKCRLIRNWDKLFDTCHAHLGTLSSMKNLVSHGEFEERRSALEGKIIDLVSTFNIWIEVQKQWSYLEGVFGNNPEIVSSLPTEAARFNNISFDFLELLKRVSRFSLVIDVASMKGLKDSFTKMNESLERTKKGLTDYLEKQRELFPRFYFLGNEDLLELIGGSQDVSRVNRHVKLMFFGVESLVINRDTHSIVAVKSPEGESMLLTNPVSLIKSRELHQWLSELEHQMKMSLAGYIRAAFQAFDSLFSNAYEASQISETIDSFPTQAVIVALNIYFSRKSLELKKDTEFAQLTVFYEKLVKDIASLSTSSEYLYRTRKIESLVIQLIHHRNVCRFLDNIAPHHRASELQQRQLFDFKPEASPLESVVVSHGRFKLPYGFEYHGVLESLAITPLVEKCYLAMTQAIAQGLGGSPFGPAGTGKTESVKALGHSLGRMVKVFNCDDSFDFKSIERILLGLGKVGCWGCFDEFNRLDSSNLSALASQIEAIQTGINGENHQVEIAGHSISVHPKTGLFVTMNPGYVGRNELPENLKRLFRSFSMERPDLEMIIDVILTSQKLTHTEELSSRLVRFYEKLEKTTSFQRHYDFGLRAIKSILRMCGTRRCEGNIANSQRAGLQEEEDLVSRCIIDSVLPKLVPEDVTKFHELTRQVFGDRHISSSEFEAFYDRIRKAAVAKGLTLSEDLLTKCSQVLQILNSHHGFMLVGEAGSGKSTIMRLVLDALSELENVAHKTFVLDCKVLTKNQIFGSLDPITREWSDGLFTGFMRTIIDNMKGEQALRVWVVFDGDIDPEWAENLNSVLDDNKVLTLPNGERLELPSNMRIAFEVDNLEHATLATISRCGMVWFDRSLITEKLLWYKFLFTLRSEGIELADSINADHFDYEKLQIQRLITDAAGAFQDGFFEKVFLISKEYDHIMKHCPQRSLNSFFRFFISEITGLLSFKLQNSTIVWESLEDFVTKAIFISLVWGYSGDCPIEQRVMFTAKLASLTEFTGMEIPENVTEYQISYTDFCWSPWLLQVTTLDLDPHQVMDPSTIVPTVDTVVHEHLIYSLVNKRSPLLLCGPPGSGKTMTLLKALRKLSRLELISLNFSKDTSPNTLLSLLEQHCCYRRSNKGLTLSPKSNGKWAVVFCDEINLPSTDKYGSQNVIALMRLMVERQGFWNSRLREWVTLENVQFVGACNDPSDPGRHQLADRFLRHVSVIMVDYPGRTSMTQIYESFNHAILKCAPDLRGFAKPLTSAMLEVYFASKSHLTTAIQSHYIYSPRELTRWCRGILETVLPNTYNELSALLRLWYHEGLRLFYDRLSMEKEKQWTKQLLKDAARDSFPHTDLEKSFKEPILYSDWITLEYEPVSMDELAIFVRERLRVFSEEELDVDLILFEDMLDHTLRVDRVLKQHQGHMILVGPCTSGKSTLTKFVAWMNGIKVIQLNVHKGYTIEDFQRKLREILIACVNGEKICFLIDESSLLETSFIERMNTLLANSEIPGLFEEDEYASLMKQCAAESSAQGHLLDSDQELYAWFTQQVSSNLHVVFTLSDVGTGNRVQVTSSPALFNRCVLSWMGDWSTNSLVEVATKRTQDIALDRSDYEPPVQIENTHYGLPNRHFRDAVVNVCISIHESASSYPNRYLQFLQLFSDLFHRKEDELNGSQRHIMSGLDKLKETVLEVTAMRKVLSEKREDLLAKEADAKIMLDKMILNQNEAERKREFSVVTQEELEKHEAQINKRREVVMGELELAEPAVLEAQRGVQNIKKQHLTEMRSMSNPPAAVKLAMESVCILLGYDVKTWRDVQLVIRKDDFIASIVSFDSETQLEQELSDYMEETYLSRPDFNYETVNRASKACGPLLQWVIAQLRYYSILEKVMPLKKEMVQLQSAAKKSRAQLIAIAEMIDELEQSIDEYKKRYSELIREAERVKVEMETIEGKVRRSESLIENLTSERLRWETNVKSCDEERLRIAGNALLSSAFAVYCGRLDQSSRNDLLHRWQMILKNLNIPFDEFKSPLSSLASADQVAQWTKNGLPNDDLYKQNFAMKLWSEFCFIIDPTEEVKRVLTCLAPQGGIAQTSFLEKSFMRHIENAMRFGGTILVSHAELYDPIMDPILRKDFSHTGGRRLVQLADKAVDILPNFKVLFFTKDSSVEIPPSLASRVNVLNFTVTSGNVENQAQNLCLERLEPQLSDKQREINLLQSDYQIKSHILRQLLLDTLSGVDGTILDKDEAVDKLQCIKSDSTILDEDFSNANETMKEIDDVRSSYREIAKHLSSVYGILGRLSSMSSFYNFPFKTLIEVLQNILGERHENTTPLELARGLYCALFAKVSPSLRKSDRVSLAIALATCYIENDERTVINEGIRRVIGAMGVGGDLDQSLKELFFVNSSDDPNLSNWEELVKEDFGLEMVPVIGPFIQKLLGSSLGWLDVFDQYVTSVFGASPDQLEVLDMANWVKLGKSLFLIAESDHIDITPQIERLANASNQRLKVLAMGTADGSQAAYKELEAAIRVGSWVVLQNVQLSGPWLNDVEQLLEKQNIHENFALFLTCLLTAKNIPLALITKSVVLTYEETPSFKRVLLNSLEYLWTQQISQLNIAKTIVLLVSWLHAILQEQLKFVPISFAKKYDFSEADLTSTAAYLNSLFQSFGDRTTVRIEEVPWREILSILGTVIYGGKVSVVEDNKFCQELAEELFQEKACDEDFVLPKTGHLTIPHDGDLESYKRWIEELPDHLPLSWFGLSEEALVQSQEDKATKTCQRTVALLK